MKKNDVRNFVVATFLLMVVSLLMIPSKVMAQGKYFKAAIEAGREKGKPYCATQINGTGWEIKGSSHSMSSV